MMHMIDGTSAVASWTDHCTMPSLCLDVTDRNSHRRRGVYHNPMSRQSAVQPALRQTESHDGRYSCTNTLLESHQITHSSLPARVGRYLGLPLTFRKHVQAD